MNLFDELDGPIIRLSSQDVPTPYNGTLEQATIVHPHQIIDSVKNAV